MKNALIDSLLFKGVTLNLGQLVDLVKYRGAVVYGLIAIVFVTTLMSLLVRIIPFKPEEFCIGLAIFCCVPTTLGVGVALTVEAKGNQALSILLTVVSNILGVVSVPFLLDLYMSGNKTIRIDPSQLVYKLSLTGVLEFY